MSYSQSSVQVSGSGRVRPVKPTRSTVRDSYTIFSSPKTKPRKPMRESKTLSPQSPETAVQELDGIAYVITDIYQVKQQYATVKRDAFLLQSSLRYIESGIEEKYMCLKHELSNSEAFYLHIQSLLDRSSELNASNNANRDRINDNLNLINAQKAQLCSLRREISNYQAYIADMQQLHSKMEETRSLATPSGERDSLYISRLNDCKRQRDQCRQYIASIRSENDELRVQLQRENARLQLLNSCTEKTRKTRTSQQQRAVSARRCKIECEERDREIQALRRQVDALRNEIRGQGDRYYRRIEHLQTQLN